MIVDIEDELICNVEDEERRWLLRDELEIRWVLFDEELVYVADPADSVETAELMDSSDIAEWGISPDDDSINVSDDEFRLDVSSKDELEAMLSGAVEDVVSLQAESTAMFIIATERGIVAIARSTLCVGLFIYEPHW